MAAGWLVLGVAALCVCVFVAAVWRSSVRDGQTSWEEME